MIIPRSFKLLGHTIDVSEEPDLFFKGGNYGSSSMEGKWIKLAPPSPGHTITQSSLEHTFLHELVHLCLYHTEQFVLNKNEGFVDLMAGLLHQAFTTSEGVFGVEEPL